jgi:hypothetical protein
MKLKQLAGLAALALASLSAANAATTNTLAGWKFDGTSHAAPYNSPAATAGIGGTAAVVGMNTNFNGVATTANADLFATNGASTGTGSVAWRIQATPNAWNTNAPLGSQGVQFTNSTVGYYQIKASFDVYCTNGAERYLQVQYTVDNGTNWYNTIGTTNIFNSTNAISLVSAGKAVVGTNFDPGNSLVIGHYLILTNGWNNNITVDFTGYPWVENNPRFGIRLVNAATGTNCLTTSGTNYNNTSGNWGFDNVVIKGVSFDTAALWTFEGYVPGTPNSALALNPNADTGSGTTVVLGMDTGLTYPNFTSGTTTNASDCLTNPGSSSYPTGPGGPGDNCWRVRAASNNGWSSYAPIASQGAEFDVSTLSYTNIVIGFDMYLTTQSESKMCVQYSVDGGTTWFTTTNLAYALKPNFITNNPEGGSANTVTGTYLAPYTHGGGQSQQWYNYVVADLSNDPNTARNANFRFRIVNASTGGDVLMSAGNPYNNNSGNCRFDNVFVGGTYTGLPSPALTVVNPNATVDAPFTITFPDSLNWRTNIANIGGVFINGQALTNTAYTITPGTPSTIVFDESKSPLLQSIGSKAITIIATNFSQAIATQPLAGGLAVKLYLSQNVAGPSASGGTLVANPALAVTDKYGNGTATAPNTNVLVIASVGGGATTWKLGGDTNQPSVGGYLVFSNLNATLIGSNAVTNAYITFTVSNYNGQGSAVFVTNSSVFTIGAPSKPFTPGNLAVLQLDTASSVNTTFSIIEVNPSMANQTSPVSVTPISATGPNALRLADTGTIGRMSLSDDGTLLCLAAFVDGSSATPDETLNLNRAAVTLNYTNQISQPMTYVSTSTGGSQPRACTTFDDVNFTVCDKAFLVYGAGAYPGLAPAFNFNNNVVVRAFGGHGYIGTQKVSDIPYNTIYGFDVIGGNPTYNPYVGANLPVGDGNAQDFYMISTNGGASYDVLYILDALKHSMYITKYSWDGSQWNSTGAITNNDNADSLFVTTNGSGGAYIYYTTAPDSGVNNSIVQLNDSTGWGGNLTITSSNVIYTASGGAFLKGLTFVPQQAGSVVELIPPPVLTAQNGASVTNVFCVTNTLVDPAWHTAITGITVNGSALTSGYDTTQAGWIAFNPSQSTLLQGTSAKNIVISATGYSAAAVVQTLAGVQPPSLNAVSLNNGQLQINFTSATNLSFSVLATNNLSAPKATWPVVGSAIESPAGHYHYTNSAATDASLFYILRQP